MILHPRMSRTRDAAGPWFEIRAAVEPEVDEVLIYDEVAWYAVDAKRFVKELADLTAPTLRVRINSPGGSVFDGLAIYNALRRHPAAVEVRIEGVAASIASVIALAGDSVAIEPSAFMMIHDPWALVIGNAADLREMADTLDKVAGSLVGIYARKTGKSEDDVRDLMAAESWFNATEALEAGLVDEVLADDADPAARARFDLRAFRNAPAELGDPELAETPPENPVAELEELEAELAETPPEKSPDVDPVDVPEPPNANLLRLRLQLATAELEH